MIFEAVDYRTKRRTVFQLVGSHTSTVRVGEAPAKWPNCAGCAAQVGVTRTGGDGEAGEARDD
jgi:hypothetical protein